MDTSIPRPSSTVMIPSFPTFAKASAIFLPISSFCAEIVATFATSVSFTVFDIFLISATTTSTAFSNPTRRTIGFAPAVTCLKPALMIDCARRVAVVVPSPATSLVLLAASFTNCAPIFSNGSESSISFATVTPS